MKKFKLSDVQATAILDIRLRQLARLEEQKLKGEKDELEAEKADIEKTLKSKARLKTLIKKELRITSYNVCYTKLLRPGSPPAERRDRTGRCARSAAALSRRSCTLPPARRPGRWSR